MVHSFFVSDIKYVTNLKGLLKYLGSKIHKGRLCIYCENHHSKDFKSGESVQQHMIDKGHCFMKNEEYDEYGRYYDFSSTFNDYKASIEAEEEDKEGKLKEDEAYLEVVSDNGEEEEDEWEDEGDDDEDEEEEVEGGEIKEESKNQIDEKPKNKIHRIRVKKAVVLPSREVKLPNGKLIGHRDYKRYYKQYYRGDMQRHQVRSYLGESMQLALLNPHNQIMLVNKLNQIKARQKVDKANFRYLHRAHVDSLKAGMGFNRLQPHFVQQCPL